MNTKKYGPHGGLLTEEEMWRNAVIHDFRRLQKRALALEKWCIVLSVGVGFLLVRAAL